MRTTFHIFVDDGSNTVGFDAKTDSGKKLSRLESAHILAKILAGLIQDGIRENGGQLILPVSSAIPHTRQ